MSVRPVRLGQKIVDEVDTADGQQRQRVVEVRELARPRIGIDEIVVGLGRAAEKCGAVRREKREPRIDDRCRRAMAVTCSSTSTVSSRAPPSMPDSSQAVPMPVTVPSSSSRPPGFDAASAARSAPVFGSDAMVETERSGLGQDRLKKLRCMAAGLIRQKWFAHRSLVADGRRSGRRGHHSGTRFL